jgi:p-hydroxybenzoate 3-monooxygenase
LYFDAKVDSIEGLPSDPVVHYTHDGKKESIQCDFVAGCDGFWGVGRQHIPDVESHSFLKEFPFAWFGILAEAPLNIETQGFCHTTRGLAVSSSRGETISRLYLQVDPEFDPDSMSDEQIWDELDTRLADQHGNVLNRGPITDKSVARLRGFVCEKLRYGNLALAGDAAHIVPPSGAKGLNLAVGDVRLLSEAISRHLLENDDRLLDQYSELALKRIWPTVHWSCRMSEMFHLFPGQTEFDTKRQYLTLDYWANDEVGQQFFRNSMLGLPFAV